MRADRRRAAGVLLLIGVLLLSGCASMPSGGKVDRVGASHRAEGESRVRVFGESPQKGEGPQAIVRGFLEATTSDEPDFATAMEYLTQKAAKKWDPFLRTTVVASGPNPGASRQDPADERGYTVEVSGRRTAVVDGTSGYDSGESDFIGRFHLTRVKEGWRIDDLPDGLILSESDFQRIYRSVNVFYYARLGPDVTAVPRGKDVLVADPVYVRGRIDPVTETVNALLDGPTVDLGPVVDSAFPPGTGLEGKDHHLSLDDSGRLTVPLNDQGSRVTRGQCSRMAAQVLHSVQSQASATVSRVMLEGPDGDELCELSREAAESYEPGRLNGRATQQYFIDGKHRVAALADDSEEPKAVEGALGSGKVEMSSVAVSRDERQGAAVSLNGRSLYVAPFSNDGVLGEPVLRSRAKQEKDRLTTPSWDGLGDLWVADRDPANPRLLRLRGGREEPEEVSVPGLGRDESIESLRISSDGVRIAMRIRGPDGKRVLQIGRVERHGTREAPETAVANLRAAAPQFEDVIAASWAGDSQLVVVGRETKSVQQLQYVGTDGSTNNQPTLPGINDVTGVAASEDESRPLLAESGYGIVRLPPDENWKTLTEKGTAPVYPG